MITGVAAVGLSPPAVRTASTWRLYSSLARRFSYVPYWVRVVGRNWEPEVSANGLTCPQNGFTASLSSSHEVSTMSG